MVSEASLAACLAVSLTAWVIRLVIVEFILAKTSATCQGEYNSKGHKPVSVSGGKHRHISKEASIG